MVICVAVDCKSDSRRVKTYCFGRNPGWKKMQFQLALNKTFCPTPPPLIHRRLKHHQRTKINKTTLAASPSSVFLTKFKISVLYFSRFVFAVPAFQKQSSGVVL